MRGNTKRASVRQRPLGSLLEISRDCPGLQIFTAFWKAGNRDAITDVKILEFDIGVGKFQDSVSGHPNFVFLGLRCGASTTGSAAAWITSTATAREPSSITPAATAISAIAPSLAPILTPPI